MKLTKAIQTKTLVVLACVLALGLGAVQMLRSPEAVSAIKSKAKTVTLQDGQRLKVQTREVTINQWQACHVAGSCALDLSLPNRDTDYPATGLSYQDAMQYIDWVNAHDKIEWRLPTAAEWRELSAEVMPEEPDPIFTDPALTWASTYLTDTNRTGRALRPSGAFRATSAGIEDLDGNVWEWTQDCYAGASGQGKASDKGRCPAFIMGGEHEAVMSYLVRDPARGGCAVGSPPAHLGVRLVSDNSDS